MSQHKPPSADDAPGAPGTPTLLQKAQARLQSVRLRSPDSSQLTIRDAYVLLHDLQVHQIELEIQNEELAPGQGRAGQSPVRAM